MTTEFKSNNLPVEKAVIINQIISDTLDDLKDLFKQGNTYHPVEKPYDIHKIKEFGIKGKGVVDITKFLAQESILTDTLVELEEKKSANKNKALLVAKYAEEGSEIEGQLKDVRGKIESRKDLADKFKKSDHEVKAVAAIKSFFGLGTEQDEVIGGGAATNIMFEMNRRINENNVNEDDFLKVFAEHVKNDFAKFSDAAALAKR